jgi:uncharacterized protein
MMTRTAALWHLQYLDQERAEKRHRSAQISQAMANDRKLAAALSAHTIDIDRMSRLKTDLHDLELEAKALETKIKELEALLSSGRISNPKELDALEKDRQMHLRHRSDRDTKILELMDAITGAQTQADANDAALKKTQATSAIEMGKLEHERDKIAARLAELDLDCEKYRAGLDPVDLVIYDRLRESRAGRAVARLKNDGCSVCGVQMPSGLVSRVDDGDELVFCPGCGRILST